MTREELVDLAKDKLGPIFKAEDEQVISQIGDTVIGEALDLSHMTESPETLNILRAVILEAIVIAYQNRGAESLKSQSELGQSNSFVDWMEYLEINISKKGKRYIF